MGSIKYLLTCSLIVFMLWKGNGQQSSTTVSSSRSNIKMDEVTKEFPYNIWLKNGEGKLINTRSVFKLNRKPIVLLFWMTTCGPCRMELNAISAKFDNWKKQTDFNFFAISLDLPDRSEQFMKRVKDSNWPFPAYFDFNRAFKTVMEGGINGVPQVFLLDNKGRIIYHKKGYYQDDEDKLFAAIKSMSGRKSPDK